MRTNARSQSAFSTPRVFLAFVLCFVGPTLAMIDLAESQEASPQPKGLLVDIYKIR